MSPVKMPSMGTEAKSRLANTTATTAEGLAQMITIMIETGDKRRLSGNQVNKIGKSLLKEASADTIVILSKVIREILPADPVDQLHYIVNTFLLKLLSHPAEFPKKGKDDILTHGAKKCRYHPLNIEEDNIVHFLPYIIIEIGEKSNMSRFVLSAYKTVSPDTPDKTMISAWVFDQTKYRKEMASLKEKGLDWTVTDDPSKPDALMTMKLQIKDDMKWVEFNHVNTQNSPRVACDQIAEMCVDHLIRENASNKIGVRDVRYEGKQMSVLDQAEEIHNFEYTPDFPLFSLVPSAAQKDSEKDSENVSDNDFEDDSEEDSEDVFAVHRFSEPRRPATPPRPGIRTSAPVNPPWSHMDMTNLDPDALLSKAEVFNALPEVVQNTIKYTHDNTGIFGTGLRGLFPKSPGDTKASFVDIAYDDAKWDSYCHHIGRGAIFPTESSCKAGLNGMRDEIKRYASKHVHY